MSPPLKHSRPARASITRLLGLLLLVNLSSSLYQLPLNRAVERRLCREFYTGDGLITPNPDGTIPEKLCKVDDVQKQLARILGSMETIWIVGDFIMTIPIGFMAEKFGSRAILLLNLGPRIWMLLWAVLVGHFETVFPIKAFFAGPIFSFVGGDCVFNSITYAIAAGSTSDSVRRAAYFGYMSSISYVVALLGPALASGTMSLNLWLPFFIGIGLLVAAMPVIARLVFLEPTESERIEEQERPLLSHDRDDTNHSSPATAVLDRFTVLRNIITSHPRNFSLLLISFFLTSLASSDTKLLPQYISKRYGWTFASAGYLLSGKAVVNFVLLTVVVPRVLRSQHLAAPRSAQPHHFDLVHLRYAKLCLFVSVVGAFAIAISFSMWMLVPSLLVYALGSALPIFTLSLLRSPAVVPVENGSNGGEARGTETQIFSIVMLVKTLGSLVGAPLMALAWVEGIAVGGAGQGIPFFFSAVFYLVTTVDFSGIRV